MTSIRPRSIFALTCLALGACDCDDSGLILDVPILSLDAESLDFGDVLIGDLRVRAVKITNEGSATAVVGRFELGGPAEFAFATPVPTELQPGQTLAFNLVYTPVDLGEDTGTLTIVTDERPEPRIVRLRGVGVRPGVEVDDAEVTCSGQPGSVEFGSTRPGTTVERTITLRSTGGAPVVILSAVRDVGTSAEWAIDDSGLPHTLSGAESFALTVRYTPADGGSDSGVIVITTDAPDSPSIRVTVCGAGIAPAICTRPTPLDVGATQLAATRTATLTIESCGFEPLELGTIALSSDALHPTDPGFSLGALPTLPQTLAPGATVQVPVRYTSSLPYGAKTGFVAIGSNALGNLTHYAPIGASVATPCDLLVAPSRVVYTGVAAGTSAQSAVLIANNGGTDCGISALTVTTTSGGNLFSLVNPPGAPFVVGGGQSVTLFVAYAPTGPGPDYGTLTIDETAGGRSVVELWGNTPNNDDCVVDISPTVLAFGVTAIGTRSTLGVSLRAIGPENCRIQSARLLRSSPELTVTVPLIRTIISGVGSRIINVDFAPTAARGVADVLEIVIEPGIGATTGGGTYLVGISGTAGDASICVMPTSIDFGTVAAGNSAMVPVTIGSCGSAELTLRGVILAAGSSPAFTITQRPAVPSTLASGAFAAPGLEVTYRPTAAGPDFGQIDVLSTDPMRPAFPVRLTGNFAGGCTEVLDCNPATIAFGGTDVGTNKLLRVICRNASSGNVTINGVSIAGSLDFAVSAQSPVILLPGETWPIDVWYTPTTATGASGTVTITSNACLSSSPLTVTGMGQNPVLPPCQPPSTFSPVEQWSWHGSAIEPTFKNVWASPLVANLTDDNGDGRIDENDVPEVIFTSFDDISISDPSESRPGVLRVLSGDTGAERFSVTDVRLAESAQLAIGDLDGDGKPEIVGFKWKETPPGTGAGGFFGRYTSGTLVALDNTGSLLWESDPFSWPDVVTWNAAAPALADLDGDGFSEIIVGREVWDYRGHIVWRGTGDAGLTTAGPHSIAVDLDLDGHPEVVAGGTVYRADGTIWWDVPDNGEGGNAVGMLDPTDPFPQVVLFGVNTLTAFDHLGNEQWNFMIPSMGATTMLPTIADFDNDGRDDVAVADGEAYYIVNGDGTLHHNGVVNDGTCCPGISAFDFEGDGTYELALNDYGQIYVYRHDGSNLYTAPRLNVTNFEAPVIADIDNDRKAEIVVAIQDSFGGTGGIIAYSNVGDNWVSAPRIWNQYSYHVTNVTEAGAIPRVEVPFPMSAHVFRATTALCQ